MSAVSAELIKSIKKLQDLNSLGEFALGGCTNLALRYNHRVSIDIDFFTKENIGFNGCQEIVKEITLRFGNALTGIDYPCKIDDQFIFLRFFLKQKDTFVKVDVLQNFQRLDGIEIIDTIRLLSIKDVGLLKMISASSRFSKKDIYDLDFITDSIPLKELHDHLNLKQKKFDDQKYETIFDLDDKVDPVENPDLLIAFDDLKKTFSSRPSHSQDMIQIVDGNKTWREARSSWLRKVRGLYKDLGLDYPKPKGYDF